MLDHGVEHAVESQGGIADSIGDVSELSDELVVVLCDKGVEFLIGDVHEVAGVSAPVHRVLVDGDVHDVLDVLLDDLLVERGILVEDILDGAAHPKGLAPIQQLMLLHLQSVLELTAIRDEVHVDGVVGQLLGVVLPDNLQIVFLEEVEESAEAALVQLLHVNVPLRHPAVPNCHLPEVLTLLSLHFHLHLALLPQNLPAERAVALEEEA